MIALVQVFKITVKEYAAYRLNFVLWRVRMFLNLLVNFFLWTAVLDTHSHFGQYTKDSIISYILYANLIATFVLGSRTAEIGYHIQDGSIINLLLKPVSFFKYYFARDIADKLINLSFAVCELLVVVWIFKAPLVAPHTISVFTVFFINGVLISFFVNLMLSFIGFWTPEIWAPRFLFTVLVFFLSGSYFPLNLLPDFLYYFLLATPFPYLFYLPAQALIGHIDSGLVFFQIAFSFFWVFALYKLTVSLWKTGNKQFSFWGR